MAPPKGFRHTAETRARISATSRLTYSPERKAHLSSLFKGKKRSPEIGAKISAGKMGKARPDMRGNDLWRSAPAKGECVYCFRVGTTHDHVIPLSRGGSDTPDNIVIACHSCNASKGPRTPDEWRQAIFED